VKTAGVPTIGPEKEAHKSQLENTVKPPWKTPRHRGLNPPKRASSQKGQNVGAQYNKAHRQIVKALSSRLPTPLKVLNPQGAFSKMGPQNG